FGLLEEFIQDENISEIMVNGISKVYVEKNGLIFLSEKHFSNEAEIYKIIEQILKPLGKKISADNPYIDARLTDGSRVNIIIPPVSLTGPMITIRKFSKNILSGESLISANSLNKNMIEFLKICVENRQNIVVSGGTGSGKTTLLNVLSSFIPKSERIITIEDTAELQMKQENVGRLEAADAGIDGKGDVTIRKLVINALRMRPDRIIVGECRGAEALDMLQAMNTGHNGSLTTVHSNSPRDCIKRIETMVLMSGFDLPVRVIREQIASAINIIVQTSRVKDGSRKVTSIAEITGMEGDVITLAPIFEFKNNGINKQTNLIAGDFKTTGTIPAFLESIKARGISIPMEIFR
ncbi:MAG: CpaF family protein, partial [Elusimicrobia bacterium]|nr:CpaF family protein [Elusimicrobiota bacterium]